MALGGEGLQGKHCLMRLCCGNKTEAFPVFPGKNPSNEFTVRGKRKLIKKKN